MPEKDYKIVKLEELSECFGDECFDYFNISKETYVRGMEPPKTGLEKKAEDNKSNQTKLQS